MTQAHLELCLTLKKVLIQFSEEVLFKQWPVPLTSELLYSPLYVLHIPPLIGKYGQFLVFLAFIYFLYNKNNEEKTLRKEVGFENTIADQGMAQRAALS